LQNAVVFKYGEVVKIMLATTKQDFLSALVRTLLVIRTSAYRRTGWKALD